MIMMARLLQLSGALIVSAGLTAAGAPAETGPASNTVPVHQEGFTPAMPPGSNAPSSTLSGSASLDPRESSATNPALDQSANLMLSSNVLPPKVPTPIVTVKDYRAVLDRAVKEKRANNLARAEVLVVSDLESEAPVEDQKTALLQLAVLAHEQQQWAKAQQIYAQFLSRFQDDPNTPEVLLRQGLLYRQMGAPVMAQSKFYAVMSTALHIKSDRLDHYQRLVLQAQSEIAETYYLQGKLDEAADYYARLLKLDSPYLDKAKILYKLVRCLSVRGRSSELIVQAKQFLDRYPEAEAAAEVRFLLADSYKKLGRNREAMDQVKALLETEQHKGRTEWTYWQQRAGNDIANQLYREADYVNALQVYQSLAALSTSPQWQFPALYQVGLVYERLQQPEKAQEAYHQILKRQPEITTNSPPNASLATVLEMAQWRSGYLDWQRRAAELTHHLSTSQPTTPGATH
jgi:tetratricopeptide (TPR) repeat protein